MTSLSTSYRGKKTTMNMHYEDKIPLLLAPKRRPCDYSLQ